MNVSQSIEVVLGIVCRASIDFHRHDENEENVTKHIVNEMKTGSEKVCFLPFSSNIINFITPHIKTLLASLLFQHDTCQTRVREFL